jgi:hypothetical protein
MHKSGKPDRPCGFEDAQHNPGLKYEALDPVLTLACN